LTWLIVEDDADIRNLITVLCQVWGHTPLVFPDGNKAFAWLDEVESGTYAGELPELALMDIRMPGPQGYEIAQRIRTIPALKNTRIALMTAFALSEDERERILSISQADKLVSKPLPDMEDLKAILDDVLAGK
jgi:hypothetical protein